ncbi:MAG: hypothetical protein RLZ71_1127 [Actinomycetota bacterium]|jgi:uncharacterized protein with FMN-binding domain
MKDKTLAKFANITIGVGAVAAGIVLGILPNGGFEALIPASQPKPTGGSATATGDPIDYEFGTVQVAATVDSGVLKDVTLIQAGANGGREQAFPMLQESALAANGTSFGNVSGATYTTDAFKAALDSALAKLP